jgi:hypothetical protein
MQETVRGKIDHFIDNARQFQYQETIHHGPRKEPTAQAKAGCFIQKALWRGTAEELAAYPATAAHHVRLHAQIPRAGTVKMGSCSRLTLPVFQR